MECIMAAQFEVYKDAGGSFRWRLQAANGKIIASSGESFSSKQAAKDGAQTVKATAPTAPIVEI